MQQRAILLSLPCSAPAQDELRPEFVLHDNRVARPAQQLIGVGETYDFELSPEAGIAKVTPPKVAAPLR